MPYKLNNGLVTIQDDGYLSIPDQSYSQAYRSTSQTIPSGSWTIIIFPTEIDDNQSEYNTSTGYFTASEDGIYISSWSLLSSFYNWPQNRMFMGRLVKNDIGDAGTCWIGYRNFAHSAHIGYLRTYGAALVPLSSGDTLHVECLQDFGSNINLQSSGLYNNFHVVKGA